MRMFTIIPGWITLVLSVVIFSDVVGIVRSKISNEMSVRTEISQRNLVLKVFFFLCFAWIHVLLNLTDF